MKRICLQCRSRRRRRFNPSQSILILTPELILSTLRYWFSLPTGKEGLGRWPLPFHRVSSLKMGLERWGLIVSWHCLFSPSLLVVIIHVCSFTKSCPTLCNPMDWSPPGSPQFSSVQSLSCVWLFVGLLMTPWTVAHQAVYSWNSPGKSGAGCHFLPQGIFWNQEWNPCLLCFLHCGWILYHWSPSYALFTPVSFFQSLNTPCNFIFLWFLFRQVPHLPQMPSPLWSFSNAPSQELVAF